MHRMIIYSIKLLYWYFFKFFFKILFICMLVVLIFIFRENLFHYFCKEHTNNVCTSMFFKQYISHQVEDVFKKRDYINLIHINFLKQYAYINRSIKEKASYNFLISHDNDLLHEILLKCNNSIDIAEINFLIQQYPILRKLKVGQFFSCLIIKNKNLKYLIWDFSPQEVRIYNRVHNNFLESIIRIISPLDDGVFNRILFIGMLNKTFADSARSLGVEENCITDIINALQYQLDFRKLNYKDKFVILTSIIINNDCSIQNKFLGARLCISGKNYYVFRANNGKFYDHKAIRLGNNFMRYPISQPFRISSNFNLHRVNPITGQVSPHSGVDFAVPVGTSVFSIGDGEVIVSSYSRIAGNYLVIKHNHRCVTRYMHLKKILVRSGQKVRRGENIAFSGNTGRSTGPHLHFEIWVDRNPVDPMTVTSLNFEKLLGSERMIYLEQIHEIIPKLCFE